MSSPEADLLKVAPNAGLDEIKKAYRKAALAHHPDQNPDPAAARHFRRLNEAYRILAENAQRREPPKPKKPVAPAERTAFLLADLKSLVKRWPADRWSRMVDGLPSAVWVAGMLDVLAQSWPGAAAAPPVPPTLEGISEALAVWSDRLKGWPLPSPLPARTERLLSGVLSTSELRLKALERPSRLSS